jgi:hypothetical protein
MLDRYGNLLRGMDEALNEKWMGSDGRLSSEGNRDAMSRIRWGRVLEHTAEVGRVTVKPPPGVAFQGRDRSTRDAPSSRVVVAEHLLVVTP